MTAKLIVATILVALGTTASYAQYARDVTGDPDATMTQEQKLGPNVRSYYLGNATITTQTPWWYPRRAYYYRRYY